MQLDGGGQGEGALAQGFEADLKVWVFVKVEIKPRIRRKNNSKVSIIRVLTRIWRIRISIVCVKGACLCVSFTEKEDRKNSK